MNMNDLAEVYSDVCTWNEKRYDREYNAELLAALLNEELDEYYDSDSEVSRLDAVCDTMYVAMGGMWKLGLENDVNSFYFDTFSELCPEIINRQGFEPIIHVRSAVDSILHSVELSAAESLHLVFSYCYYQLIYIGFTNSNVVEAMSAVCTSNNTKSVKKTKSDCKANDGDKGEYYVSPTLALTKILERVNVNKH